MYSRRVVGTAHPDYHGLSWAELLGDPEAPDIGYMKRMRTAFRTSN